MKKLIASAIAVLTLVAPLSANINEAINAGDFSSYRSASSYEVKKAAISAYLRWQEEHNVDDAAAYAEGMAQAGVKVRIVVS